MNGKQHILGFLKSQPFPSTKTKIKTKPKLHRKKNTPYNYVRCALVDSQKPISIIQLKSLRKKSMRSTRTN